MATALKRNAPLFAILALGLALKIALLIMDVVPFNSDEAVIGLMARHILQGERPVFFYGQAYMGSLDAWLVAGVFAVFGPSVMAIRVVYVTANQLQLDAALRDGLARLGVSFQEKQIGLYHVFYDLSRKVVSNELGGWRD